MPIKPFLKWDGGKYRLLDRIFAELPPGKRLLEPFCGAASVGLNGQYDRVWLNDGNPNLVEVFAALLAGGEAFIDRCGSLFVPANNHREAYLGLREAYNTSDNPDERAALFIYLNRHGFNGLCRFNRKGGFNVPFGRDAKPYCPRLEMEAFIQNGERFTVTNLDFEAVMEAAEPGDVIYCDPPYLPLSTTAKFSDYGAEGFSMEAQRRLAESAMRCAGRGIPVVVSNHDTADSALLYRGARIERFAVQRNISCNAAKREKAAELLAVFS